MSKSKPALAEDVGAQQILLAAALQHGFQRFEQVAVFAAQVEKALAARRRRSGAQRHALEHQIGLAGQQHAILEGAGLALVGVADDDSAAPPARCGRLPI